MIRNSYKCFKKNNDLKTPDDIKNIFVEEIKS